MPLGVRLQAPHGLKIKGATPYLITPGLFGYDPYFVPGGRGKWAVWGMDGLVYEAYRFLGWRWRRPLIGYQERRMTLYRRKANRMNGLERKRAAALWHAITQGWFPDWDPDHRYPQFDDFDIFNDYTVNDWRWGVTGAYPPA